MYLTREMLNEVAKAKKINLDLHDHVAVRVNENYTKVCFEFYTLLVMPSGDRKHCQREYYAKNRERMKESKNRRAKKIRDSWTDEERA